MINCPVCKNTEITHSPYRNFVGMTHIVCSNCGEFAITAHACNPLEKDNISDSARAALSYGIWRNQQKNVVYEVDRPQLDAAQKAVLPDPAEQLDLLVLFYGTRQESPGHAIRLPQGCLRAKIGAVDVATERYIFATALGSLLEDARSDFEIEQDSFIDSIVDQVEMLEQFTCARLTMKGWKRFHEIQRGATFSRKAFMAMPFGDPRLTEFINATFRPAVKQTGYDLKRLDDESIAGNIDNRMRVEIRLSRFLVADLTHMNAGAYWEAGFAEGLDKPVFYTCEKSYFDDKENGGAHFDTNHSNIVIWEYDKPEIAAENLKATIRATLPFEAKMTDD